MTTAAERAEPWLQLCGACDAGLTMNCTCPEGDVRNVLSDLVTENAALRARLDAVEKLHGPQHVTAGGKPLGEQTWCGPCQHLWPCSTAAALGVSS